MTTDRFIPVTQLRKGKLWGLLKLLAKERGELGLSYLGLKIRFSPPTLTPTPRDRKKYSGKIYGYMQELR